MKQNLTLLLLAVQLIFLVGCKKEKLVEAPVTPLIVSSGTTTYDHNSKRRLVRINRKNTSDSLKTQTHIYDGDKLSRIEAGNGYYQKISYSGDKISMITEHEPNGNIKRTFRFTYDGLGRLSMIDDDVLMYIRRTYATITYGANGLPETINVKGEGWDNSVITFKDYTKVEFDMDPWILADFMKVEFTHPLLFAGLTRFPGSIEVKTGTKEPYEETFLYSGTDRKLGIMSRTIRIDDVGLVYYSYFKYQ